MGIGERLARVESGLDWIKVILALIGAFMIGGFAFFGVQFNRLDGKIDRISDNLGAKIDAIPQRLSEEFRAMRAEMSAQTSAIANSITATRQAQPPAPPQIIVLPPRHSRNLSPKRPSPDYENEGQSTGKEDPREPRLEARKAVVVSAFDRRRFAGRSSARSIDSSPLQAGIAAPRPHPICHETTAGTIARPASTALRVRGRSFDLALADHTGIEKEGSIFDRVPRL
jgi:hypothetical protein